MSKQLAYADPQHEGNSAKYHTGKPCIEEGCENPAGTWWSPVWCFHCNVERIDRISRQMNEILNSMEATMIEEKGGDTRSGA